MPTVGIIGAGTMGSGIAQTAAAAGWSVVLSDVNSDFAHKQVEKIKANLGKLVEKGKLSAAERDAAGGRLMVAGAPADFGPADFLVEAVVEDLDVKCQALAPLLAAAKPGAIIASNTSSLSISKIGRGLGVARRTVGMHFFNPVPLMPLVEVIAGEESDPAAVQRTAEIARQWGKTVVHAKDTPGFIVNRVARGYYLESLRMLGEGVGGVDEIDRTLKSLGGFRMGPFELMDLIGIDVNYSVSRSVYEQMGNAARFQPHPIQARLVDMGRLGRKTKRGFYSYDVEPPLPAEIVDRRSYPFPQELHEAVRRVADAAVNAAEALSGKVTANAAPRGVDGSVTQQYVLARVLVTIFNEAALAVDQGVATAADIDTAMKLGTNYPHGPLEWAEKIGRHTCASLLRTLDKHSGDGRFAPAEWLTK